MANEKGEQASHDEKGQNKINDLIDLAKQMIVSENFEAAKRQLHDALKISEATKSYSNLAPIYDLLVSLSIQEGKISDAEEMLVRFIERFLQIGYADNDNLIVRYKLKLSRLYQIVGNTQMAEIGYRSCVNTQESKIQGGISDPTTANLYLSSLFWYGRFLTEGSELMKAQTYMRKAIEYENIHHVLEPAQLMVFLFHTAEISFKLQQYDDSLMFLSQAVELCMNKDPDNTELPVFMVKMGVVFYHMKMYEESHFWCEKGLRFARMYSNSLAEEEALSCLRKLKREARETST